MKLNRTLVPFVLSFALLPVACGGSQEEAESPEDAAAREAAMAEDVEESESELLEQMNQDAESEDLDAELAGDDAGSDGDAIEE